MSDADTCLALYVERLALLTTSFFFVSDTKSFNAASVKLTYFALAFIAEQGQKQLEFELTGLVLFINDVVLCLVDVVVVGDVVVVVNSVVVGLDVVFVVDGVGVGVGCVVVGVGGVVVVVGVVVGSTNIKIELLFNIQCRIPVQRITSVMKR